MSDKRQVLPGKSGPAGPLMKVARSGARPPEGKPLLSSRPTRRQPPTEHGGECKRRKKTKPRPEHKTSEKKWRKNRRLTPGSGKKQEGLLANPFGQKKEATHRGLPLGKGDGRPPEKARKRRKGLDTPTEAGNRGGACFGSGQRT